MSLLLQEQISTFEQAYKEHVREIDESIKDYKLLYRQYKEQYAENNNYIIPYIRIVNMVVSTFLYDIDVNKLKKDQNIEYYPKRFPGFVFRVPEPRSTMLLFKTGKVICTGIREKDSALKALDIFLKHFKLDQDVTIDVQNLVVSVNFQYNVELEEFSNRIDRAIYEPEQFPGIIYRSIDPKAVFLIFTSGKAICVGTKDLPDAFKTIFALRKKMIESDVMVPIEDDD